MSQNLDPVDKDLTKSIETFNSNIVATSQKQHALENTQQKHYDETQDELDDLVKKNRHLEATLSTQEYCPPTEHMCKNPCMSVDLRHNRFENEKFHLRPLLS